MANISPLYGNLHHLDAYLEARGLKRDDLLPLTSRGGSESAGIKIVEGHDYAWYQENHFGYGAALGRAGVVLTYLNPDGLPYMDTFGVGGEAVPYTLLRYLTPPLRVPVGTEVRKVNSQWGRPSRLHFQPLESGHSWSDLPEGSIVVHCESLIKAVAISKYLGLACVGYNGVNGFSAGKVGMELIHKFVDFDFRRYTNVILFDSNVAGNESVARARASLCHKMRHILGCDSLKTVDLPKPNLGEVAEGEEDWGPDDFLMKRGADALAKLVADAEPYVDERYSDLVATVNKKCRWVTDLSCVFMRERGALLPVASAKNELAQLNRIIGDKGGRIMRVFGYDEWMSSENREDVDGVQYRYLEDEFFLDGERLLANTYRRGGVWPAGEVSVGEGVGADAKFVVEFLERLMPGGGGEDLRLFRAYLKFLKFGGRKPTSYPVLWSNARGVGKGYVTRLATVLLGDRHVGVTTADQLVGSSNDHIANRRLVVLNDVSVKNENKSAMVGFLKTFIGDDVMAVKKLFVDVYKQENRAGLLLTANHREDVPSDGLDDRRQWYVECAPSLWSVGGGDAGSDEWRRLWSLLDDRASGGAMEGVARWVRDGDDVDFMSWRPNMTDERRESLLAGRPAVEGLLDGIRQEFVEAGYRIVSWTTVEARIQELGWVSVWSPRTISTAMKNTGWGDRKRMGPNKITGWIPDPGAYNESADDWAEMQRAAMAAVKGSNKGKY